MTASANCSGDTITYRDSSGRIVGTKQTSSSGKVTFRNASGSITGPDFK